MKLTFIATFFAILSLFVSAQPVVSPVVPAVDAERVRISADRASLEASFLIEDAACYKKFTVNNCRNRVNNRRLEAIADLRRREILLNDEERRVRGEEQIRKLEEKSSLEKQQGSEASRAKALDDSQSRRDKEKQKKDDQAKARSREKTASQASAERLRDSQRKAKVSTDKQAEAANAAKIFDTRQNEAQEKRARHERDRLKDVKPTAKSLSVPE
jgi:colicin import membrane protein